MKVCLGISGGIAAYKSADLLRLLQQQGLEVQVVMTRNACQFVSPLTFAALSGRKVITGMFEEPGREANIESAIEQDRKSTRLNSSHHSVSRMPSSA